MSGMKKPWIIAVAAVFLMLLLLPCNHVAMHSSDSGSDPVCKAEHMECHDCSVASACSWKPEVRPENSSPDFETPVRQILCVRIIDIDQPVPRDVALSFKDVLPILTFQLLI
jgi:hypothetical protein